MDTMIERQPIQNLQELLQWKRPECSFHLEKLRKRIKVKEGPKVLVCHDMQGGYLDDRFIQGAEKINNFRFFHWANIDTFIYFSHHFVTIPPQGWISAAHRNGVQLLGTFITEWDEGSKICDDLFKTQKTLTLVACKLDAIARFYGFDGWLINIENKLQNTENLENFIYLLTEICHTNNPGSVVIWYDSVITTGELKWQNELNISNRKFFDACDGIFLNYNWKDENLKNSAILADKRKYDVYVGIDVFGRGCLGGGGFNTQIAVRAAIDHDLSIAIFAPGWVFETLEKEKFLENQYKFWELFNTLCPIYAIAELPFSTTFCQGFGKRFYRKGKVISEKSWYNLGLQQIQPSFHWKQSSDDKNNFNSIYIEDAYNSGGCLELKSQNSSSKKFRLLLSHFEINSSVLVTYTYKSITPMTDVDIIFQVKNAEIHYEVYFVNKCLKIDEVQEPSSKYLKKSLKTIFPLQNDEIKNLNCSDANFERQSENNWNSRVFYMDFKEFKNNIITEISAEINNNNDENSNYCSVLIGEIQVLPIKTTAKMQCLYMENNLILKRSNKINCILKWNRTSSSRENSYDIFCCCDNEKYYIGTTTENFYYLQNFCIPEFSEEFKFCAVSQDNQERECNSENVIVNI